MQNFKVIKQEIPMKYNNKHFSDETESNIEFAWPGQVMLGSALLHPTSLDLEKPIKFWMRSNSRSFFIAPKDTLRSNQIQIGQCTCNDNKLYQFPHLQVLD